MNILFVADVPLSNPTSGSEQVLNQQATGLSRHGIAVSAITRHADPAPALRLIRNVKNVREGTYGASAQKIIPALLSLVKYPSRFYKSFVQNSGFQGVICHQPFNCFSLLINRKFRNTPMIYVFHSPSHVEYLLSHENESRLKNLLHAKARCMIEGFCLRRAMKIMVLSRYMKKKVVKIHRIPDNCIIVNPGGVDLERFKPLQNRTMLKKELNFPEGKIHLLTIRNIEPRMGLENLLKCICILKNNGANIYLTIGGQGIELKKIENLIVKYGLANDVSMTGFIPPDMLTQYYCAADFFVLPTRCLEGFGLVTPESMACGTPVLGTPVGGTIEILSGFDQKFLFRDTSPEAMTDGIQMAIKEYFFNGNKYNELRVRCRKYAEDNYSWQGHIDRLKSIL